MTNRANRQLSAEVRRNKERRLDELEQQAAIIGVSTPPHVLTEIDDLRAELELVDVLQQQIDPKIREAAKGIDYSDLLLNFLASHARRLTSIEAWQTSRDEKIEKDEAERVQRRNQLDIKDRRIYLALGALILATCVNFVFGLVVMIILLSR